MQTELDRIANLNHLQLIKALIPHLPASNRKRFSVMVKIMELQNVIRFYGTAFASSEERSSGTSSSEASEASESPDLLDVLSDVRCYCEGEEQQMIDQALQLMSMVELFSMMAQDEGAPGSDDCDSGGPPSEYGVCNSEPPTSGCGVCDSGGPTSATDNFDSQKGAFL